MKWKQHCHIPHSPYSHAPIVSMADLMASFSDLVPKPGSHTVFSFSLESPSVYISSSAFFLFHFLQAIHVHCRQQFLSLSFSFMILAILKIKVILIWKGTFADNILGGCDLYDFRFCLRKSFFYHGCGSIHFHTEKKF